MPRQLGARVPVPEGSASGIASNDGGAVSGESPVSGPDTGAASKAVDGIHTEETAPASPPTATQVANGSSSEEIRCPICDQTMLTLAQLNQHIDDEHLDRLEPAAKSKLEQLDGWLGLGMYLRDEIAGRRAGRIGDTSGAAATPPPQAITHAHWQRPRPGLKCSRSGCERAVDRGEGINCRKCGKLYCRPHVSFRRRLAPTAVPDPAGTWARVCEPCFTENSWWEGPPTNDGPTHDWTDSFAAARQQHVDMQTLVIDRLEKRMAKLVSGLTQIEKEAGGLLTFRDNQRRSQFEQDIVAWEDERPIERCRLCGQKFTYFTRKHHCRVCGRVMCGDMDRECSREVSLATLAEKLERPNLASKSSYSVRVCIECRNSVFGQRNFRQDVASPQPRFLQLHRHLKHKRDQIDALLPRFQDFAERIGLGDVDPGLISETKAVRKQLLAAFSQFDAVAGRIRDEKTDTVTEDWMKQRISAWATEYLQQTMLPLQALPQILQKDEQQRMRKDEASTLQNKLVVLEEQKFMVDGMVREAKQRRKFEDLRPLQVSLQDLEKEIDLLREQLGTYAPS